MDEIKVAKIDIEKKDNNHKVYEIIKDGTPFSIQEVAEKCGRTYNTVSRVIESAMRENIVTKYEVANSTGGRRAQLYIVSKNSELGMLAFVSDRKIYFKVVNLILEIVQETVLDITLFNVFDVLVEQAAKCIGNFPKIKSLFIAIDCIVKDGVVIEYSVENHFKGFDIIKHFTDIFSIDVFVSNNIKTLGYSIDKYTKNEFEEVNAIVKVNPTTITFAFVINGKVLCGESGAAGEAIALPFIDERAAKIEVALSYFRVAIAMVNPKNIIIYNSKSINKFDAVLKKIGADIPSYLLPNIIVSESIIEDGIDGLKFLCDKHFQEKISIKIL